MDNVRKSEKGIQDWRRKQKTKPRSETLLISCAAHLCFFFSWAPAGVSLKYAFKLMHDLIVHLHSAVLCSAPLHLLSFIIFSFPSSFLPSTVSQLFFLDPPHTPFLFSFSLSALLCLIYSQPASRHTLSTLSSLKGRNRRRDERSAVILEAWDTQTSTVLPSIHLLFCLLLPSLHPEFVLHQ